ncbi:MAG: uroporphyrinogen decarboxylase family protein [Spirochaetaceae bacterium]|nr:MAG: uroporphyrinogen decarboxylase family protein [Spirochaetaceae bacterium]
MNSAQRIEAAISGEQPDCVPVAPYMGNYGARLAGVPIDRYCTSGKLMAEAQYRAWQICTQDVLVAQSDNYYIAEGFGLQVEHHTDGTPTARAPLIENLQDILSLRVPDPRKDGRMPVYLEAIDRLHGMLDGQAIVRAPGTGPFSLAGHLLGTQVFLTRLGLLELEADEKSEIALTDLLQLTTHALIVFARACLDAGARIIQAGDSLASSDMISPGMYRRWALPFERSFFDAVNGACREYNAFSLLHICGDNSRILAEMADTGAMIVEIDSKIRLDFASRTIGDRVCLMGNLDPTTVLLQGSADSVEKAARQAIEDAGERSVFILGSGCEVPPDTPLQNMKSMIRVARQTRYASRHD